MAIIETKYGAGDIVYWGTCSYEEEYIECPDCLGTKKVHITFADKRIEQLNCYTCLSNGWGEVSMGKLSFNVYKTALKSGIVLSVDLSNGDASYRVNFGYETDKDGRSHEQIYYLREIELFENINDALSYAEERLERHKVEELKGLVKKKGGFAKRLEDSSLGYSRRTALEEERNINRWLKTMASPYNEKQRQTS